MSWRRLLRRAAFVVYLRLSRRRRARRIAALERALIAKRAPAATLADLLYEMQESFRGAYPTTTFDAIDRAVAADLTPSAPSG